jgi:hypothetical protein
LIPIGSGDETAGVEPAEAAGLEVLALVGASALMTPLLDELRRAGLRVDIAADLPTARTLFFGSGGHDCLLVAPDVVPALAKQVLRSLRGVAPELATASFSRAVLAEESPLRAARLGAYHPGSRAAVGAVLRFLQRLTPTR